MHAVAAHAAQSSHHAAHAAQSGHHKMKHLVPQALALQAKLLVSLQEGGVRPTDQGGSN